MKQAAYYLLLEISEELRELSVERKIIQERYEYDTLVRNSTGMTTVSVKDLKYASINCDAFARLSTGAVVFAMKEITTQLKRFNMLWHRPASKKSQEKKIISELIQAKLLFRTETPGMYLVSPLMIWRGNSIVTVEATKALLREHKKPSPELIRDLRPGERYETTSEERQRRLLGDTVNNLRIE